MRRKVAKKHRILPDAKFGDVQVTTFVNNLMLDGKKSVAFTIFYNAIERVSEKTGARWRCKKWLSLIHI